MNEIVINNTSLGIKEYNGQRVVTFRDIDTVHHRPEGTARRSFTKNKKHFIEGQDFFKAKCSEVWTKNVQTPNGFNPDADIMLFTEMGYLMLVKSFRDDLAWAVQRELTNCYFKVQQITSATDKESLSIAMIENKEIRQKYIDRTEVLDKVKQLFLIPHMELMTIHQVAEYYEVDCTTVKNCYKNNTDEFNSDGVSVKIPQDFKKIFKDIKRKNNKFIIDINENVHIEIPSCGIFCFSKRAVLRFGMLLKDSEIAKEVRTQLLNISEKIIDENPEQSVEAINNEMKLMENIMSAYNTGDPNALLTAACKMNAYKQRHITRLKSELAKSEEENKKLSEDNNILSGNILTWSSRANANAVVRLMAKYMKRPYSAVWNFIYRELLYKYGINLKQRGDRKPPYIAHIKQNEWKSFHKSACAIMQMNGISPTEIYSKIAKSTRIKSAK